ncbi:MAG: hypothetical protein ABJG78_04325 [Cyclobacteriaceae bacterium]
MNKFYLFSTVLLVTAFLAQGQMGEGTVGEAKYYYQIPDCPESYSAGTVAARVVDGLGFRYFHATAGLTEENLSYKPSEEARTMSETIDHILGLTRTTLNAVLKQPTDFSIEQPVLTFEEKRLKTLENIRRTSEILKNSSAEDMESYLVIFLSRNGNRTEYPFWNQLNGPIADAVWHVGQVVTFRRSAGNPFNSNVSVLRGKVRDK